MKSGKNLVLVFKNDYPPSVREPLFFEHEGNRAVRHGDWKLVSRFNYAENRPEKWELYNMRNDRTETHDLSEQLPAKAEELMILYDAWAAKSNVVPFEKIRIRRNPKLAIQ
jgi:arylsulfatase